MGFGAKVLATLGLLGAVSSGNGQALKIGEVCLPTCTGSGPSKVCVFQFRINIHASETGYYEVEGCEGVQPTLYMEENVEHIFEQHDPTNWFHPLGFAYGPDGVYGNNAELEKVQIPVGSASTCNETASCQYPQYRLNEENLCSTDPCELEDFGLDEYEGVYFSGGRDDWIDQGNFSVSVTITDPVTTELFYFCHIHNFMSGRIKVTDASGVPKDANDNIPIPYEYHTITAFDEMCGTHNMSQYENFKEVCPDMTFLCADDLDDFGKCMAAIDCAMHVEMRVSGTSDPTVTFMHQMIAHHRNAVNMAKILLKANPTSLKCGTAYDGRRRLEGEQHDFCHDGNNDGGTPAVTLLWDIVNTQNHQITFMESWLRDNLQPSHDYCEHQEDTSDQAVIIGLSVGAVLLFGLGIAGTYLVMSNKMKKMDKTAPSSKGSLSRPGDVDNA